MPITAKTKSGVVKQVMHEAKHGNLHSGKGGPAVKNHKQQVAIALSIARKRGYK